MNFDLFVNLCLSKEIRTKSEFLVEMAFKYTQNSDIFQVYAVFAFLLAFYWFILTFYKIKVYISKEDKMLTRKPGMLNVDIQFNNECVRVV